MGGKRERWVATHLGIEDVMVSHRRLAVADPAAPLTDGGFNPHARAVHIGTLTLENGAALPDVVMTYECWGELNDDAREVLDELRGASWAPNTTAVIGEEPAPAAKPALTAEARP